MKTVAHFLLPFALAVSIPLTEATEARRATLTEAIREVHFRDGSNLDRIEPAQVGKDVRGRDILTTGERSRAELLFDNDLLTRLGSNTIFSFEPDQRILNLERGLALVRVPKGSRQPVQMRTPAATAAITGTTCLFSLQPSPDAEGRQILKLAVLEGNLQLTYPDGRTLRLSAGQMAISTEGDRSPPTPVDFDIDRLVRTSGLINDFERPLGSENLLDQASRRQERAFRTGRLAPTGLVIAGSGTEVRFERDFITGPVDTDGALERNRERIRETHPDLFDNPHSPDRRFFQQAFMQPADDQSGAWTITSGTETFRSAPIQIQIDGRDVLDESAQAISGFEWMRFTGLLEIDSPLDREFIFLADGVETSPAIAIENFTVHQSAPSLLQGPDPRSILGFIASHDDVSVRGQNTFTNLDAVAFAALEGNVSLQGKIQIIRPPLDYFPDDPYLHLHASSTETLVEGPGDGMPIYPVSSRAPEIFASAQDRLVIGNSSHLATWIQGGELPAGAINLESRNGTVEILGTNGSTTLETGSISAIASRNIAVVDSRLFAWQGDISLVTGEEGTIDVLRSTLKAHNRIFMQAGTVNIHHSSLTATDIIILRNQGNFEDRAGAEAAGNQILAESLTIRPFPTDTGPVQLH